MLEEKSKYRAKKRDLEELKDLFEENLINEEDYEKASEIRDELKKRESK